MELSAAEGRVLGCLIEQEALAPDAVPLTLNVLRLSCNQTTGRVPVVAFDDRTVEDTLLSLKSRGLARFFPPTATVRTTRYRQRADVRWRMGAAELAVLSVLLLGGVQTVAEVRAQVQLLDPTIGPAEVDAVLDALAARTPQPFAARVSLRPGDAEVRWVQVLTAPAPTPDELSAGSAGSGSSPGNGGDRGLAVSRVLSELSPSYAELVARVAELERRLAASLERAAAAAPGRDWSGPALPAAPPVDVRTAARPQLGAAAAPARPDVSELAERIGDIERRVRRIEAELGALR
jgi:uncharacterized protein YceH (UPF0502 family)